ncbi:MAG: M23 family metallopeptidase [Actinomycetota bacterium]
MVGIKRTLIALLIVGTFAVASPARAAEQSRYYSPVTVKGQTFPVLLSADDRWLNWRDTYGAPRMRLDPKKGVWEQTGTHQGIDIFTERATPVVALQPGVIENLGWTFYSGWRVGVRGDDTNYYFYAHLLGEYAPGIALGVRVSSGQRLGSIGSSGYGPVGTADEFPPHLHFGIQSTKRGWLNPQPLLEELYDGSVSSARASKAQTQSLRYHIKVLRSRMYSPGTPSLATLAASITLIEQRLTALEAISLIDR